MQTPTPNTIVLIFAHYPPVVFKHAYFCPWLQSIYISFSLPSRPTRFSMCLYCLVLITSMIILHLTEDFMRAHTTTGNVLASGEAKRYNPEIPAFEELGIWYHGLS